MKRVIVGTLLLLLAATFCLAQEEPIPPKRSKAPKIGGLFGYTPGWMFVDVSPLNDFILPAKGAALKNNGVYMNGIGGSAYIIIVPNLRVGGIGMHGSEMSTSLDGFGVRRDVEMSVGFGGVTVEYVTQIVDRLDLVFGLVIGRGGIDLTLRQDNGSALSWTGEWGNFGNGTYNQNGQVINSTRTLTGTFFVLVPSVSLEYSLLSWVGVRFGASYVGMMAPSWQVDNKYDLLGVPGKVSGKGFLINAGVFVGTF